MPVRDSMVQELKFALMGLGPPLMILLLGFSAALCVPDGPRPQ